MNEPNLSVLEQKLTDLVVKVSDLAVRLDRLAENLSNQYVAKATYDAHREADDRRVKELEKDNDARAATMRQIGAGLAIQILFLLILAAGVINNMGK